MASLIATENTIYEMLKNASKKNKNESTKEFNTRKNNKLQAILESYPEKVENIKKNKLYNMKIGVAVENEDREAIRIMLALKNMREFVREDNENCPICLEKLEEEQQEGKQKKIQKISSINEIQMLALIPKCDHKMHYRCFHNFKKERKKRHETFGIQKLSCPTCRREFQEKNVQMNFNPPTYATYHDIGKSFVGRKIVKEFGGNRWDPGKITKFVKKTGTHTVNYLDGTTSTYPDNKLTNWLLLSNEGDIIESSDNGHRAYFDDIDRDVYTNTQRWNGDRVRHVDKKNKSVQDMYGKWFFYEASSREKDGSRTVDEWAQVVGRMMFKKSEININNKMIFLMLRHNAIPKENKGEIISSNIGGLHLLKTHFNINKNEDQHEVKRGYDVAAPCAWKPLILIDNKWVREEEEEEEEEENIKDIQLYEELRLHWKNFVQRCKPGIKVYWSPGDDDVRPGPGNHVEGVTTGVVTIHNGKLDIEVHVDKDCELWPDKKIPIYASELFLSSKSSKKSSSSKKSKKSSSSKKSMKSKKSSMVSVEVNIARLIRGNRYTFYHSNGTAHQGTFLRYEGGRTKGRIEIHKVTEGPVVEDWIKRHGSRPKNFLQHIITPVSRVTQLKESSSSKKSSSSKSSNKKKKKNTHKKTKKKNNEIYKQK